MQLSDLEAALYRAPFIPFDLHVDNGKVVRVKHTDFLLLNESKTTVVVADGDHFHIVDLDHISAISFQTATGAVSGT